jgi:hypothetical protein
VKTLMESAFTSEALKQALADVARDEAEAIGLLVNLLAKVRETSNTAPLEDICKVVVQWQHEPPNAIVSNLMKIEAQFEDGCRARAKR